VFCRAVLASISTFLAISPILCLGEELRIGISAPFDGPLASLGAEIQQGAVTAAKDLYEHGGAGGRTISVISRNDSCMPALAANQAHYLTEDSNDKVAAVIGPACNSAVLASSAIYAKVGIAQFLPSADLPLITAQASSSLFRLSNRSDRAAILGLKLVANVLHDSKIAIVTNSMTPTVAQAVLDQVSQIGAKVT